MINGYAPCTLDELEENKYKWQETHYDEIEKSLCGTYLPTYIPPIDAWGVETSHGVEVGDALYVTDQFCWDSVMYLFYDKCHKEHPNHAHGDFKTVIEALLASPEDFSIEGFEKMYSVQERRVLMNVKNTINQVKLIERPITREEADFNRRRLEELMSV